MDSSEESEREDSVLGEDISDLLRSLRRDDSPLISGEGGNDGDGGDSSSDDDVGLLDRLKRRFDASGYSGEGSTSCPSSPSSPLVEPLASGPPISHRLVNDLLKGDDSDEDDDLQTLRAIQRRFSHYEAESHKSSESTEYSLQDKPNKDEFPEIESQFDPTSLDSSTFPKSAQLLIDALKKNRSCQKLFRRKLMEMETKMEENKELINRVKCLTSFQAACKRQTSCAVSLKRDPRIRLISVAKSRDLEPGKKNRKNSALYYGPAQNSRVLDFREVERQFPFSLKKKPWSDNEKENLLKGIKQQYQEMVLLNAINIESDTEGANNMDLLPVISNTELDLTPEKMRSFVPMINWNRLASMYLPGRSGTECESRFLNCEDQLINHGPWTSLEDKKLLYIIQNRGICNWIEISVLLGTQRTPYQCLVRYQRSLNPLILNRDWTKEEDEKLLEAVETFGDNNWQVVASHLDGRIANQCSNRWKRTLNPERKNVGRWTLEEDKRLKVAILLFTNKDWNKIAQFVTRRTSTQCRERWVNCLDPNLNLEPWTKEEDSKLLEAVKTHGYCWSKIPNFVPSRTDNQCWRRWKFLCPEEVTQLQRARKIKRTVLISNFVSRKHERPEIGPNDFIITPVITCVNDENAPQKKSRKSKSKKSVEDNETNNNQINQNNKRKRTRKKKSNEAKEISSENLNNDESTTNKKQRKKADPGWIHAEIQEGNRLHWKCKYCNRIFKGGGVSRLKMHLAGITGDVVKCSEVPPDIRNCMIDEFEKSGKKRPVKNKKRKNGEENGTGEKPKEKKRKEKQNADVDLGLIRVDYCTGTGEVPLLEFGTGTGEVEKIKKVKGKKRRRKEKNNEGGEQEKEAVDGGADAPQFFVGTGEVPSGDVPLLELGTGTGEVKKIEKVKGKKRRRKEEK